jgi:hypothetical protein
MIIDLILDRKDGKEYKMKEFYNRVSEYGNDDLASALDSGLNQDIEYELIKYTIDNGYDDIDGNICNFIRKEKWLTE